MKKNRKHLFNSNIPVEFLPIKAVVVSYAILLTGMSILLVADTIFSGLTLHWLLVPLIIFFQLLFSIGISFFLSLLSLVFKDLQLLIQYIVIILLVLTPIAYTPDMIPENFLVILYLNPLFYFIYSYQSLILLNQVPPANVLLLGAGLSLITFISGLIFFRKARQVMIDFL